MSKDKEIEILYVEDNPNDAEMTLRAFTKKNFTNKIHHARDGAEALEFLFGDRSAARGSKPKLVLLDLKLPKVDGMEVLKKIKADPETATIPVVILTSSNEEQDVVRTSELGSNSYIVKPVDFDKFVEAVASLGFYWLLLNRTPR